MSEPRKVALGPVLDWDEAALDALSTVTPEDVELAKFVWREEAPPKLKTLLDATPVEDEP